MYSAALAAVVASATVTAPVASAPVVASAAVLKCAQPKKKTSTGS
jgi:hypothetical protein